jgi:hypothetical protein
MRGAFSRRRLLIGAAVLGTVVSTSGALWVSKADAKTALLNYFKRVLPGVTIDEKSALACIDDFLKQWVNPPGLVRRSGYTVMIFNLKIQAVATAWQVVGVEKLSEFSEKFELIARKALTFFLVNSNFFHTPDPRQEPIVYIANAPGAACNNPFANLEPLPTVSSIGSASRNP